MSELSCDFCKEPMRDGATVCAVCRREQRAAIRERRNRFLQPLGWTVAGLAVFTIGLVIWGAQIEREQERYCLPLLAAGGYGADVDRDRALRLCARNNERINADYSLWKRYVDKLEAHCRRIGQDGTDVQLGLCEERKREQDESAGISEALAVLDTNYN